MAVSTGDNGQYKRWWEVLESHTTARSSCLCGLRRVQGTNLQLTDDLSLDRVPLDLVGPDWWAQIIMRPWRGLGPAAKVSIMVDGGDQTAAGEVDGRRLCHPGL